MAAHILKLEQYREDEHGLCTRMTHKFMKNYKKKKIVRGQAGSGDLYEPQASLVYIVRSKPARVTW